MLNMLNSRVDLLKRRSIAAFSIGLCVIVLQMGCESGGTPSSPTPSPSAPAPSNAGDQEKQQTGEKKLTATGIDSVLLAYEFEDAPTPSRGVFGPVAMKPNEEVAIGKIKDILVFDNAGMPRPVVTCNGGCTVTVAFLGAPNRTITISELEETVNGSKINKIELKYVRTLFKRSRHKNWSFHPGLKVESIVVDGDTQQNVTNCHMGGEKCSVGITYNY